MISAQFRGLEKVKDRLERLAPQVNRNIEQALTREALHLVGYIQANKLSDQVLHVRTGRLRRSITARFEGQGTGTFRAYVGTNVKYARAHEYGFEGSVNIREHKVKEHTRMQKIAFGKLMTNPRRVTVKEHTVAAHTAHLNIKARPFLKPSLEENAPRITKNIRAAITAALREARS